MGKTDNITRTTRRELDTDVARIGAVAGLTLLADTVGTWGLSAVGGGGLRPLALVVVLATITVGTRARWGLALGLSVSGFFFGGWPSTVATVFAAFGAATLCGRLWTGQQDRARWLQWLRQYVTVAVLTTLILTAAFASLLDLFGISAFSIVVAQSLGGNLVLSLLGTPVAWLLTGVGAERGWAVRGEGLSPKGTVLTSGVLLVWVGGGSLGSFLYQAANTISAAEFGRRLGATAERIVVLGGTQGRYAVFALSVLAVLALVGVFWND